MQAIQILRSVLIKNSKCFTKDDLDVVFNCLECLDKATQTVSVTYGSMIELFENSPELRELTNEIKTQKHMLDM